VIIRSFSRQLFNKCDLEMREEKCLRVLKAKKKMLRVTNINVFSVPR